MLINTVILLLRDMMPLAILFMWLAAYLAPAIFTTENLLKILSICAVMIGVLFSYAPNFSEYFDGAGLEMLFVSLTFLLFFTLLVASLFSINKQGESQFIRYFFIIGLCSLFIIKGLNFLIYFNGYLSRGNNDLGIILGIVVAIGIAGSFSVLYYFVLRWLVERYHFEVLNLSWGLFISGLLAQIIPLLGQIGRITDSEPIWNTQWLIQDSSEYGHILKALIGYEATPSLSFVIVYFSSLTVFYLGLCFMKQTRISFLNGGVSNAK